MAKIDNIKWIVFFGYDWSVPSIYGAGHIIHKFHELGKNVLWINPIPHRNLSVNRAGSSTAFFNRIKAKLLTQLKIFRRPYKSFFVLSPIYIPNVENEKISQFNLKLLKIQTNIIFRFLNVKNYLLCFTKANNVNRIVNKEKSKGAIFIAGDLYHDLRGISEEQKNNIYKRELEILNSSDVIFAASKRIESKITNMINNRNKVRYLPHGVDYDHFSKEVNIAPIMNRFKKPIVGYFGSLSQANDQEVLIELAKVGFNIVLIGKIMGDYSECYKYTNINFLGPVDYKKLPEYAAAFDVCILNWKMAEWIKNCNPKKTLEYLSLGIPIVSVRIPEIELSFKEVIYFADTVQDFVKLCKKAIAEDNEEKRSLRKSFALNNTWDKRMKIVLSEIEKIDT